MQSASNSGDAGRSQERRRGFNKAKRAKPYSELMTCPIRTIFPIFVSNRGITVLCDGVYKSMVAYEPSMVRHISSLQLQYVTCIAYMNRIMQFNSILKPSDFEAVAWSIRLPEPIANYIACIGKYKLLNGCTVGPWADKYEKFFDPALEQVTPEDILRQADRPIPDNPWKIDTEWIVNWNMAPLGMRFTKVDNRNIEGGAEMLVTPIQVPGIPENVTGNSPQGILEEKAKLGAIYNFRSIDNRQHWPGNGELLHQTFTSQPFHPRMEWSAVIRQSFTA